MQHCDLISYNPGIFERVRRQTVKNGSCMTLDVDSSKKYDWLIDIFLSDNLIRTKKMSTRKESVYDSIYTGTLFAQSL